MGFEGNYSYCLVLYVRYPAAIIYGMAVLYTYKFRLASL